MSARVHRHGAAAARELLLSACADLRQMRSPALFVLAIRVDQRPTELIGAAEAGPPLRRSGERIARALLEQTHQSGEL
ncbi:hypothetical protein GCM10010174_26110 [Kutzneria viridogrisea]|uniref:Uncharacterized protein n=1 Tax=Kutzneria viridogrisea TaxID=47990 RepID=A0ABR6BS74_9PSEU|nr:hypothetical protein [Kutzneria viridogrisea]